jgi:hypothetical protein
MSIEPIRIEVRNLLAETNDDIRQTERELASAVGEDRVRAAGRLVSLQRHRAELEARRAELERCRGGALDTVVQWVKEDWMILTHQIGHWIETR